MKDKKFIIFKGKNIELTKLADGIYMDDNNTVYAYTSNDSSVDKETRAGIGWFSLSKTHILSEYSRGHDFAYSSPYYQAFHTREEADHYLEQCLKLAPGYEHSIIPELFEFLSRQIGIHLWENKDTNT